jgi:sulfur-oxidizing protein SoxX
MFSFRKNRMALLAYVVVSFSIQAIAGSVDDGRALAYDYEKGNCLACHAAPTDELAVTRANIGPPFLNVRQRFPDRELLFKQIWDARHSNPNTIMPPFGAHKILSTTEINLIVDYLLSL